MDNSDWEKIIWAIALGAMIWFMLPRVQAMIRNSRQATLAEWMTVILPLSLVIGFVILLIILVR